MIIIFVKYSQFKSNSFANLLEKTLEMQSWSFKNLKIFSEPPFLWTLGMTVEINQKKLYYNYYTSGKFLTLKFKFQVKPPAPPPPPTSNASLRPCSVVSDIQPLAFGSTLYI